MTVSGAVNTRAERTMELGNGKVLLGCKQTSNRMDNSPRIITLTTDFGTIDAYVGVMKGVILGINPNVQIVDITHAVPPQDIHEAAFLIHSAYRYFPEGTVHAVVVDPGVGSDRRAIVCQTDRASFVCPDNGILTCLLQEIENGGKHPTRCRRGSKQGLLFARGEQYIPWSGYFRSCCGAFIACRTTCEHRTPPCKISFGFRFKYHRFPLIG